jgi:Carboxypeptidase regulatory-like domain
MRFYLILSVFSLGFWTSLVSAEQIPAPEPQPGSIIGTVTDIQTAPVPSATITIDGPTPDDHRVATANESGFFEFKGLRPGVSYQLTVSAKEFANWTSPAIVLKPGEQVDLGDIEIAIANVETSVKALLPEQIALQQVQVEEKQRIIGFIPNFYVSYDPVFVPLTKRLKFQLALRSSVDAVTFLGVGFLAGVDMATGSAPDYQQGAAGYGQRFGAIFTDSFTGIMIGGAVLPSLLHQDPRYFYQGTGTNKSRFLHAIALPFVAKGDNGHWQFNYSTVGGDLASGAISNLYYPEKNRGPGIVFRGAAIDAGGRAVNGILQEFFLNKLTSHPKPPPP